MKRVFRSCLDPLPRFLSTRGLVLVVLLVLTGTALSVHEYVRSGREPERAWPRASARNLERPRPAGALPTSGPCASAEPGTEAEERAALGGAVPAGAESEVKPATLFRPDDASSTGT